MADVINVTVTNGGTISADMTDATVVSTSVVSGGTVAASVIGGGKGEKGDTGATGATGATGSKGDTGDAGAAATIAVGTTTTGAAGSDAAVTNSGTSSAVVLDFTVPQGAKGDTGPAGATGADGAAATITVGTTTTDDAGTDASVTNSGTTSAAVFDFTIPKGETGDTGATGAKGDKGDTGATGATGPAGSDGTDGADGKTVLNGSGAPASGTGVDGDFYIDTTNNEIYGPKTSGAWGSGTSLVGPTGAKGDKGDTGTTGATGATGATGSDGADGSRWYEGSGAPSTTHNDGDFYLNTSSGDVYEQTSGSWGTSVGNIKGPSGSGSGDMLASTYDPNGVAADAFDQDNMADGTTNKNYTATEKTKLAGIATGAEVNVQADWDSSSGDSQILNKPSLGTAAASDTTDFATAAQGALADTAIQPADLGDYVPTTRTVAGKALSGDITIGATDLSAPSPSSTKFLRGDNTWQVPTNTTYSALPVAEGETGTATTSRVVRADYLKTIINYFIGLGTAAKATILETARNINGVSFDGSADITITDDTKVPTTRTVNGHALSADVTVSKSDVGLGSVTNDAQLKAADLDTDGTLAADSDTKIASQKAIKTYVDTINTTIDKEKAGQASDYTAFGDSITYGYLSTDPTVNAYPIVLAGLKGWTVTNKGYSGARINDGTVLDVILSEIVDETKNYSLMIGTNDARIHGTDLGYLDTFRGCLMAEVAWLAIPDEYKLRPADQTVTGSWAANSATTVGTGHGYVSTASGGTITATVVGTSVYIQTYATLSTGQNFSITIDGVSVQGWDSSEHDSIDTRQDDSIAMSAYLLRYSGLNPGAHTVVITAGSVNTYVDWIAGNGFPKNVEGPNVWLSNIIRATQGYYDAHSTYSDEVVALYNGVIASVADDLMADNLNVGFVDSLGAINNSTDMYDSDDLHPNDGGYAKLANAFYGAMSSYVKPLDRGGAQTRDTGWIDPVLQYSWVDYGGDFSGPRYRKRNGFVELSGSMKSGTTTNGTTVFALPIGFRPVVDKNFPVISNSTLGFIRVKKSGLVQIWGGGSGAFMSLDGIIYSADS